jgi:hypothetical protein
MTPKWHMKSMKALVLPGGVSSKVFSSLGGEIIGFRFHIDEFGIKF